ncbi:MAG: hypothetical protein ACK5L5_08505 [Bacteroidales bacterium]
MEYCQNNPVMLIDPTEMLDDLEVTQNNNGTYTVVGGQANSDKNIYVVGEYGNRIGETIGEMLTEYSFHSDSGDAVKGANIDLVKTSSGMRLLELSC